MEFQFNAPKQEPRENSNRPKVDYDALNQYIIDTVGISDEPEALVGIVSSVIALGTQKQQPEEEDWKETAEQKKKLEEYKDAEVIDKYGKKILTYPKPDREQVTFTVDFPEILLNKASYFGQEDAEPKPLRLVLGGEFSLKTGENEYTRVVARGANLTITNIGDDKSKVWSMSKNSNVYKMAQAAGVLRDNGAFLPEDLGKLIGKPLMFEVQVYNKQGKNGGSYYTEYIKFNGKIPRGFNIPQFDDSILHIVNFNGGNDQAHLKQLRAAVKNTIKRAVNYEGSGIQKEFEELESNWSSGGSGNESSENKQPTPKEETKATSKVTPQEEPEPTMDWDDDK